jgi:hypothetical protein
MPVPPDIVCVLPEPVWPYASTVPLYPCEHMQGHKVGRREIAPSMHPCSACNRQPMQPRAAAHLEDLVHQLADDVVVYVIRDCVLRVPPIKRIALCRRSTQLQKRVFVHRLRAGGSHRPASSCRSTHSDPSSPLTVSTTCLVSSSSCTQVRWPSCSSRSFNGRTYVARQSSDRADAKRQRAPASCERASVQRRLADPAPLATARDGQAHPHADLDRALCLWLRHSWLREASKTAWKVFAKIFRGALARGPSSELLSLPRRACDEL